MWPDEIPTIEGTIYMEIGDRKVELLHRESVRVEVDKNMRKSKFRPMAWTKKSLDCLASCLSGTSDEVTFL